VAISVGCFLILLVSDHSWPRNSLIDLLLEFCGFIFIGICILGRLWCTLYICGYKSKQVITQGPYAIVRHPLYLLSFIGAIGIGMASENLLVLAILTAAFLFYYPLVMLAEERKLIAKFGQTYLSYVRNVPRFLPRRFRLYEPEVYPTKPRLFLKSIRDAMWFFWFFMIVQLIERLHIMDVLPVYFKVP
jgi:protein-S-isoprenylcysteine O-methyltransferase Ste14